MAKNPKTIVAIILVILGIAFIVPSIVYFTTIKVDTEEEKPLNYNSITKKEHLGLSNSETSFLEKMGLYRPERSISLFDGLFLRENEPESPLAVIVENHGLSREQQSGLSEASVVYETYVEGGITRFLAIYPYQSIEKVGPVRSARPYFLDWALEHAHSIVHAGGSEVAMQNIFTSDLIDIDEDELNGAYLYRDQKYERPHNLFADLFAIRKSSKKPVNGWHPMPFQFSEKTKPDNMAHEISIRFGEGYDATFSYNPATNSYVRYQRGSIHKDSLNNKPLSPSNIIVQFTTMEVVDEIGRLNIRTKGSGKAFFFTGGGYLEGAWKFSQGSTVFLDNENVPVTITPGQTWIVVIDSPGKVSFD